MEIPDHRQRECDNIDIQDQEKNILDDPHDVYIDAVPSCNAFVPGVCNRRALKCRGKDLRYTDSNG